MKKTLFLFILFFIAGCSLGNVELKSTRGNKYTFKNNSVYCFEEPIYLYRFSDLYDYNSVMCEGTAIKKNIAGQRFVHDFKKVECIDMNNKERNQQSFVCTAAKKLGKLNNLSGKRVRKYTEAQMRAKFGCIDPHTYSDIKGWLCE